MPAVLAAGQRPGKHDASGSRFIPFPYEPRESAFAESGWQAVPVARFRKAGAERLCQSTVSGVVVPDCRPVRIYQDFTRRSARRHIPTIRLGSVASKMKSRTFQTAMSFSTGESQTGVPTSQYRTGRSVVAGKFTLASGSTSK